MKILRVLILLVAFPSAVSAEHAQELPYSALENLVYHSAVVQGRWPEITSATLHTTNSVLALDSALEIVGIAQHLVRSHGEEILSALKTNSEPCNSLAYKYARFSDCDHQVKMVLYQSILDSNNDIMMAHLEAQAALELSKMLLHTDTAGAEALAKRLAGVLERIDKEEVWVNRYWAILEQVQDYMRQDQAFNDLIATSFPVHLIQDMKLASGHLNNPEEASALYIHGIRLTYKDMYKHVPDDVRTFWCEHWACESNTVRLLSLGFLAGAICAVGVFFGSALFRRRKKALRVD